MHPGGAISLSRPSLRRPLSVIVTPLAATGVDTLCVSGPCGAVFVADPERAVQADIDILHQLWGLTATEAKIASMLASGLTLADMSDRLAITGGTVKWHLKHVLGKTQTNRQAELVRLLVTSSAFLGRR